MQVVQKFLGHNFRIINFWLRVCVLPEETRQFPESLRCTAWNVACNQSGKVSETVEIGPLLLDRIDVAESFLHRTTVDLHIWQLRLGHISFAAHISVLHALSVLFCVTAG